MSFSAKLEERFNAEFPHQVKLHSSINPLKVPKKFEPNMSIVKVVGVRVWGFKSVALRDEFAEYYANAVKTDDQVREMSGNLSGVKHDTRRKLTLSKNS